MIHEEKTVEPEIITLENVMLHSVKSQVETTYYEEIEIDDKFHPSGDGYYTMEIERHYEKPQVKFRVQISTTTQVLSFSCIYLIGQNKYRVIDARKKLNNGETFYYATILESLYELDEKDLILEPTTQAIIASRVFEESSRQPNLFAQQK